MKTLTLLLTAAFCLVGLSLAAPGASATCYWNPDFSEPVEGATNGYVDFRDGAACTVWVFPCDDYSTRMCLPQ